MNQRQNDRSSLFNRQFGEAQDCFRYGSIFRYQVSHWHAQHISQPAQPVKVNTADLGLIPIHTAAGQLLIEPHEDPQRSLAGDATELSCLF